MHKFESVKKLFIFFFMGCITLPSILLLLGIDFQSDENRTLSERPEFKLQTINTYPSDFTAYYEDNMPFKDFLVKCNAFINTKFFSASSEKAVIYGKDGWLFYNSKYKENSDTLEDFLNFESISQEELEACKDTLVAIEQSCEENGAQFIFMVTPNKMTIYGDQFMPDIYKRKSAITKVDVLVDYLRDNTDLKIVYPKDELLEYKDSMQIYYKLDSHWNQLGGYIGYRELYEAMFAKKIPKIEEVAYTEEQIQTGDLAKMLKVENMDDINYNVEYKNDIYVECYGADKGFYSTSSNQQGNKLLMFRDSYTTAMENYIIKDFTQAHLNWSSNYDEKLVREEQPNVVVYQIVERSVFNIPLIEHNITSQLSEMDKYNEENIPEFSSEEVGGYCLVEQVENELEINGFSFIIGGDSKQTEASVILVGADISYEAPVSLDYRSDVEEAYNVYEGIGYSGIKANVNLDNVKKGSYDVYIILKNSGRYYYHNLNYMVEKK